MYSSNQLQSRQALRGLSRKPIKQQSFLFNRQLKQPKPINFSKTNGQIYQGVIKNRFMARPKDMPFQDHPMTQIQTRLIKVLKPHE